MEGFKSWLEGNSFKSNGGFLPHLRRMNNPDLPTYSKASFHKQPKEGYKLQIFEKLWVEFLLNQPEQENTSPAENVDISLGSVAKDLRDFTLSDDPVADSQSSSSSQDLLSSQPPAEFTTAFTPCTTVLKAATWNCQQLRFIFDEKKLDSVAHFLSSSSFDLIFLQEIPPREFGKYRMKQLIRAMDGGSSLAAPKFLYILGRETVVLDTTSQLNAIIYPAHWKVLQHTSLTSFLHPPVMAWFKVPGLASALLTTSFYVSPSVGLASSSSASQEPGIPSTPSKATSTASKTTIQTRVHLQLSKIVETESSWDIPVPTATDQKDLSPRWIIGGDLNVVPDSLPHELLYTTPRGMPTAIASDKTLDAFIVDPLTAKTHNTLITLVKTDPTISDHNLVSLLLEEY